MKIRGAGLVACTAVSLALAIAPAMAAEPSGDPSAAMYEPTTVDVIHLTLSPAEEQKLNENPETYVKGTFSLAETDGTPGGEGPSSAPMKVEIRLKGQLGSKRSLAQKAAFKLKFKKTEQFLGLKKMTLNNMVQDPSEIHETLAYKAFRSAGVPASRTGYAYVYLNGVDYGLHLNIETLDDVALEKRFGPFQHLYEGEYGSDVETGPAVTPAEVAKAAEEFEIDEGIDEPEVEGEKFRADLETLIATVNGSSPDDFSARVATVADLKEMTRMWAVEKYIGHWDGYSGQEGIYWPNNYYLLSDPAGRFQMLPWGTDQTWSQRLAFDGDAGVLFDKCLDDESCAEMYRRSLRESQTAINDDQLDSLAVTTAALLLPWEEMEQNNDGHHEHDLSELASAVQGTRDFIAARPAELASYLESKPAEVPASNVAVALRSPTIVADGLDSSLLTATITNAKGDPVPGDHLSLSSSDGAEQIGEVTDNDDGTYTATVVSSTALGVATITATDTTVHPAISGTATLVQAPGPVSRVTVALQPTTIPADGTSTSTVTATATDAFDHPVPGIAVFLASTDAGQHFGPVTDHGDGTYSSHVTSSTTAGKATITATVSSSTPAVSGVASLTQQPVPPPPLAAPVVTIIGKPSHRSTRRRPTFAFTADEPGSTFSCKLDGRPYRECSSPERLPGLAPGAHAFRIVAANREGTVGSPVVTRFVVEPRRRRRIRTGRAGRRQPMSGLVLG